MQTKLLLLILNLMWEKPHLLVFMLVGFNIVIGLLIGVFEVIFSVKSGGMSLGAHYLSACFIGRLYSERQGIVIPSSLRFWVSIYNVLIWVLVTVFALLVINTSGNSRFFPLLGISSALCFVFTYWGLSFGSKQYMKRSQ